MYGLVNKAVRQLIQSNYGKATWDQIRAEAGYQEEDFINMEGYPDELTFQLVAASSRVLGLNSEQILEAFGEYWIIYTAQEGYGDLLKMGGDSLYDFLKNLDQLHSCVGQIMPALHPPSFQCTEVKSNALKLHHFSHRKGLEYMVVGLIKGLGKRYNKECVVTILEATSSGADHNVFYIEWSN
jgi:hypothetical protein